MALTLLGWSSRYRLDSVLLLNRGGLPLRPGAAARMFMFTAARSSLNKGSSCSPAHQGSSLTPDASSGSAQSDGNRLMGELGTDAMQQYPSNRPAWARLVMQPQTCFALAGKKLATALCTIFYVIVSNETDCCMTRMHIARHCA